MATPQEAYYNVVHGNVVLWNNQRLTLTEWESAISTGKLKITGSGYIDVDVFLNNTQTYSTLVFKNNAKLILEATTGSGSGSDVYCNTSLYFYDGENSIGTTPIGNLEYTVLIGIQSVPRFYHIEEEQVIFDGVMRKLRVSLSHLDTLQRIDIIYYPYEITDNLGESSFVQREGANFVWLTNNYYLGEELTDFLAGDYSEPPVYPGDISHEGGGNGSFYAPNYAIPFAHAPTICPISLGFTSLYNPSVIDCQAIAHWLWSDDFDDAIHLNYISPFDNILSIGLLPISPNDIVTTKSIFTVGNVPSSLVVPKVNPNKQFVEIDCGELEILEFWENFLDYDATYSIYLPFIGYRSIRPDDFVNGRIWVKYICDLLSGNAVCGIGTRRKNALGELEPMHVLYQYPCNILFNISFSGANFMSLYNQQLSATVSGINNASNAISRVISGDIFGGVSSFITGGLMSNRQYETAKPDYGRGGNNSGNSGFSSIRYPYLIQNLPIGQTPDKYKELVGVPSMIYKKLSTLTGYTEIETANVSQLTNCTDSEKDEILTLLKGGVYL